MPLDPHQVKALFLSAVELPAEQRGPFLDQACAGDAELRQRLEHLLQAHDRPDSIPDEADAPGPTGDPRTGAEGASPEVLPTSMETPGAVIGSYKLIQAIGEGGMGTVWMAQQTEPIKRLVALKVIKAGMDSRQVIARFEAERQALALMDHPNIAKVLDAGTTQGEPGGVSPGRPYFVMELVKGVPITRYCDTHRLSLRERLELFVGVCQAVQHAHQKGIIHRDLKPSNVLVALYDGRPVPKVIDFGVAKATGPQLTEKTLVTGFGALVGTLEYMSPEQAELNQLDIDTRSDIYSLGVLLYELLTGTTPLNRKELQSAAILELLRIIREEEPPRPSTRLSTTDELPSIAANRSLEPKKLSELVRGEPDWIVMKCLEKDRNRRYQTANALALDLQRYLADEPVEACPPSAAYRLRKFARRHKLALTSLGLVAAALVLGTVVSTWQAIRATRAEDRARAQQEVAEANFRLAFQAVDRYFTQVSNHPDLKAHGLEELRRDLLRTAKEFFEKFLEERQGDPDLKMELGRTHNRLGVHAQLLGANAEAVRLHQEALRILEELKQERPEDAEVLRELATSHDRLGTIWTDTREWAQAEEAFDEAIALLKRLTAKEPANVRFLMDLGQSYNGLANLHSRANRSREAESAYQQAITIAEQLAAAHPEDLDHAVDAALATKNLGLVYANRGKWAEAEQAYTRALPILERLARSRPLDPKFQELLASQQTKLGIVYMNTSRHEAAEAAFKEAIRLQDSLVRTHPKVPQYQRDQAMHYTYLAALYHAQQRWADTESVYRESLAIWERLARDYPDILKYQRDLGAVQGNLGKILQARNQLESALDWYGKSIATLEGVLRRDPGEPWARQFLKNNYHGQALTLSRLQRYPEALQSWERAIDLAEGEERTMFRLDRAFERNRAGQYAEAVAEADALA